MDYAFLIYLASTLGNVTTFLAILSVVALVATGIGVLMLFAAKIAGEADHNEDFDKQFKTMKGWFKTAFVVALLSCFIPGERIIYMMVGASIVQDVVEDPRTAGITDRVVRLIEQKLDEELDANTPQETNQDTVES